MRFPSWLCRRFLACFDEVFLLGLAYGFLLGLAEGFSLGFAEGLLLGFADRIRLLPRFKSVVEAAKAQVCCGGCQGSNLLWRLHGLQSRQHNG
jgi:hypothetical protein